MTRRAPGPVTLHALGRDGQSILLDLDGASPAGGFITTESRARTTLTPGDVIRWDLGWAVVVDVRHDGWHGMTTLAAVGKYGATGRRTLIGANGAEVRTDARIDADTLWTLAALGSRAPAETDGYPDDVASAMGHAAGRRADWEREQATRVIV